MDILSHTFSGVAAVSTILPFTNFNWKQKVSALVLGAFAGAFPDLDAVSLYSKFGETGKSIYFGKLWYSHHAFNHSLLTGAVLAGVIFFIRTKFFKYTLKNEILLSIGLFIGFCAHLLEDMPTPYCVWGGVRLLFPSESYFGGSGKIWWWNNYDLFLIILSISFVNLSLGFFLKKFIKQITLCTTLLFCSLFIYQINNRKYDYNYVGFSTDYNKLEDQSKEEQKSILGEKLYRIIEKMDTNIPLNF